VIVNDGYVIAGSKLNSTWGVYLIKVDKNGCIEWQVNNKNNNNKAYAIADGFVVAGSIQLSDTDAYILKFGNGTNVWFNLSDTTIKVKAQGNILNGLPLKKEMKIEKIEVSNTNVNALDLVSLAQSYSLFYRDFNILPTMPYDPSIERVDDKGNAYKIAFNDMANSYYIFEDQNFKTIKVIAPTISSATIFSDVLPQTLIITDPVPVPPGYRVVQKISLLPGLDNFDYRAEKYSQVILDAAFQIGLRKSENADTLEKLSEIVDLAGFTTSDGKKIGDVLVYGKKELTAIRLKPSEIQTNLKNWEKVVKWGKVAKHLEKLDLALSAASFTTEISGDAFRAMVIYSLANAEAEERLDAIGWFIEMNKDNLDPAIVKGYEIARQKFDKMMGDYYSILQNEILKNRRYVDLAFLTTSLITYMYDLKLDPIMVLAHIDYHTFKWLESSVDRVQRMFVAETLAKSMDEAEVNLKKLRYLAMGNVTEMKNVLSLLNTKYYLAFYYYSNYYDTLNDDDILAQVFKWIFNVAPSKEALDFLVENREKKTITITCGLKVKWLKIIL